MNIRSIQEVQIATLKDIRDFCNKNNIKYFLYCGTLLGCIRHGGFIPWDDDVDLTLPLEDYKKFSKLIAEDKQFAEKYTILGSYYDPTPAYPWLKISRKNTIYYDERFLDNNADKGIAVDIYPLIGEYDNAFAQKIQKQALRLQRSLFLLEHNKETDFIYVKNQRHVPLMKLAAKIPFSLRARVIDRIRQRFWPDHNKHRYSGTVDAVNFSGKFRRTLWEKSIEKEFEGEKFTIPEQYDMILKLMYFNYMDLPPVEKRKPSHMYQTCLFIGEDVAEEIGIKQ